MNEILRIKARHLKGTDFESNTSCAIAKAAKEQFNASEVNVSTNYLHVGNTKFFKMKYDPGEFNQDKKTAAARNYSEEVIREVNLVRE